ncbi:hypothetical protein EMPG_16009 [Blastomyces silverae]|uniref:Nephrocystin 3-like N-terminal domain-containing protein n=1 Tax=Blastomyces silverae TaxID=2060906 RepID=A0A0H1BHA7_9EURO|nr:hypothetical protein EMPG_16009 [Blastomyces silverae]
MDPVTAFGLAVNVATAIDLGFKLAKIYKDGTTRDRKVRKQYADQIEKSCRRVRESDSITQPTPVGSAESNLQECAKRCLERVEALQTELKSMPGRKYKRLLKSLRIVVSDPSAQLEQELQALQSELDTSLLVALREKVDLNEMKTLEQFKVLDSSIKKWFTDFYAGNAKTLDLVLSKNNKKVLDALDEVLRIQKESEKRRDLSERKNKLLESLIYGNPYTRMNDIKVQHDGTFEWIFEKSEFPKWLETEKGIFWIQGKPASGKSTLMKFIHQSSDVQRLFERYEPTKESVMLAFYFFLADNTKKQNSQKGFLCSLLHQFLEVHWELDSSYLSDEQLRQKRRPDNWNLAELKRLLFEIVPKATVTKSICVFVDALDECQDDDLTDVIQIIMDLKRHGLKVCVSSRPEPRILRRLQSVSRILKIEEYTRKDIEKFVADQFGKFSSNASNLPREDLDLLSDDVAFEAAGVFLWAILVSRDICKGIENGDTFTQLEQRLKQVPGDLTALYKQMLERLGSDIQLYKSEAGSYFKAVMLVEKFRDSDSPYLPSPHQLRNFLTIYKNFRHCSQGERQNARVNPGEVAKRISTVCAGMLDINDTTNEYTLERVEKEGWSLSPWTREVTFVHRTARDFLSESGREIPASCKMSEFEIFFSIADVYLKRVHHNHRGWSRTLQFILNNLPIFATTDDEKLKFLMNIDGWVQQCGEDTNWIFKTIISYGAAGCVLKYDFITATVVWGQTVSFLDQLIRGGVSFSQKYKAQILLFLLHNKLPLTHFQRVLDMGADPSYKLDVYSRDEANRNLTTSPWRDHLLFWHGADCVEIAKLFLKYRAPLDASMLCGISSYSLKLVPLNYGERNFNIRFTLLYVELNARYALEKVHGIPLEHPLFGPPHLLPPLHRRVLLVRPIGPGEWDGGKRETDEYVARVDDLPTETLVDTLVSLRRSRAEFNDPTRIQARDDVEELCRKGRRVDPVKYLTEYTGYSRKG